METQYTLNVRFTVICSQDRLVDIMNRLLKEKDIKFVSFDSTQKEETKK